MKSYKTKSSFETRYFLIMGNLFYTDLSINVRYDLKGAFPC